MLRTQLYADPNNVFVHDAIFASCRQHPEKTALVDTSCGRRITYAEYGETVEALAGGLVEAGLVVLVAALVAVLAVAAGDVAAVAAVVAAGAG